MTSRSDTGRPAMDPAEDTDYTRGQTIAQHAAQYTFHRPGRWTRPDGAEIRRDTYQPTYTATRPDGTTHGTYTGAEAILWIAQLDREP